MLFVDPQYPMSDPASDVRMFAIVRLLLEHRHDCHYFVSDIALAESRIDPEEVARYRGALGQLGVNTIERTGFKQVLSTHCYDLVFFKDFYPAEAVRQPLKFSRKNLAKKLTDIVFVKEIS